MKHTLLLLILTLTFGCQFKDPLIDEGKGIQGVIEARKYTYVKYRNGEEKSRGNMEFSIKGDIYISKEADKELLFRFFECEGKVVAEVSTGQKNDGYCICLVVKTDDSVKFHTPIVKKWDELLKSKKGVWEIEMTDKRNWVIGNNQAVVKDIVTNHIDIFDMVNYSSVLTKN